MKRISKWERLGTILSIACAIECMTLPFLAMLLPLIGIGFISSHRVEAAICIGALGLCSFTIVRGYRSHGKRVVLLLLSVAAILMIGGHFIVAEKYGAPLGVLGALTLVAAQMVNRRQSAGRRCCAHHHGPRKVLVIHSDAA